MKKLIILVFIFCFSFLSAQSKDPHSEFYHNFTYGMGIGFGPENIISFIPPKLSVYYFKPINKIEYYCGAEISTWVMLDFFYTTAIVAGVKSNIFTFDTSLSNLYFPRQDDFDAGMMGPYSYFSLNPKIGLKLGWFWFKFGRGIILNNEFRERQNFFNEMKYNYEISLNIPFKVPNYKKINEFNYINR